MSGNEAGEKNSLETLHRGIVRCGKCRLSRTRQHAVPGEGPHNAGIMFIGEAPGEKEDEEGKPFRGRSGRFFDALLETIDLRRDEVYITSSVKCRPPGNRDPKGDELAACRQAWLEKQIEILAPDLIVLLGKIALRQVLGETGPLDQYHGRLMNRDGLQVLPTYHPAAGMRFPQIAGKMKSDFAIIRREL